MMATRRGAGWASDLSFDLRTEWRRISTSRSTWALRLSLSSQQHAHSLETTWYVVESRKPMGGSNLSFEGIAHHSGTNHPFCSVLERVKPRQFVPVSIEIIEKNPRAQFF
jgi:hypothetical protein